MAGKTVFLAGSFALWFMGAEIQTILLILTTLVSLEAIYLAIFIQMTVNRHTRSLAEVEEDIDEIAEEVEDIGEGIDEIAEDIDRVEDEVEDISEDVDRIQEDDKADDKYDAATRASLESIEAVLQKLIQDIEDIKTRSR